MELEPAEADRWRPLPDHRQGSGLVTVGRPLGICRPRERAGSKLAGLLSHGRETWMVDLATYRVLELCQRGHSERFVLAELGAQGLSREVILRAKEFAVTAGLLVSYSAQDATMKGGRSLARYLLRQRGAVENELYLEHRQIVLPEGKLAVSGMLADFWGNWSNRPLYEFSNAMYSTHKEINDAVSWCFWLALRSLALGIMWLDAESPAADLANLGGVGGWIQPYSFWHFNPTWSHQGPSRRRNSNWNMNEGALVQNLALPQGSSSGDQSWKLVNGRGQEVVVSRDAYALFAHADTITLAELVSQLQAELSIEPALAVSRVVEAVDELRDKDCIRLVTTTGSLVGASPAAMATI